MRMTLNEEIKKAEILSHFLRKNFFEDFAHSCHTNDLNIVWNIDMSGPYRAAVKYRINHNGKT